MMDHIWVPSDSWHVFVCNRCGITNREVFATDNMTDCPNAVKDWMQLRSGRPFWPSDPRPEDIDLSDIIHTLSMLCRFGGHTPFFYSVAEHSMLVADNVPQWYKRAALLHDATEAYVGDVVRPLKRMLPQYGKMEDLVWKAIATRFDLPMELPESVKRADNAVLAAEASVMFSPQAMPWHLPEPAVPVLIRGLTPDEAKIYFEDALKKVGVE